MHMMPSVRALALCVKPAHRVGSVGDGGGGRTWVHVSRSAALAGWCARELHRWEKFFILFCGTLSLV